MPGLPDLSTFSAFPDDLGAAGAMEDGVVFPVGRRDEGGAVPGGVCEGSLSAELEESVEGAEGKGEEAEEALGIHADDHVDGFPVEVDGACAGEDGGGGGGEEVLGVDHAVADGEGAGGVTGFFVAGAFVADDAADDGGEGAEDGDKEEVAVFEADGTGAVHGADVAGGGGEVDAAGDGSLLGLFESVGLPDVGEAEAGPLNADFNL